ncbi:hypothetical protein QG37_01580 [Candidozyma auris]|uniref:Uncharacterized protein n=1 Tax=Candidozyma auris TaxID=498019 RepID=A0A0L0P5S5_CANAR|nr:hypothetical protein QG37_01580 [[Candida] auris]
MSGEWEVAVKGGLDMEMMFGRHTGKLDYRE